MITLCVENYCQNCPYFEPVAEKLFTDEFSSRTEKTTVCCVDRDKCYEIHKHIVEEEMR